MHENWFYLLAGVAALVGAAVLGLALFRDRPRGRRRCPKCWYDLSASGELNPRCSECGYLARKERKLHKTRRHWRWAMIGVVVLVGAVTAGTTPKVKRDGWWAAVPTTALIIALPEMESYESGARDTLERRIRPQFDSAGFVAPNLWDWQWKLMFEQCLQGDDDRLPGTISWYNHYEFFLEAAIEHGDVFDDPRMREVMAEALPVEVIIKPKLPLIAGESARCEMRIVPYASRSLQIRVIAVPDIPERRNQLEVECMASMRGTGSWSLRRDFEYLGKLPIDSHSLEFDVTVEVARAKWNPQWMPYETMRIVLPVARNTDQSES